MIAVRGIISTLGMGCVTALTAMMTQQRTHNATREDQREGSKGKTKPLKGPLHSHLDVLQLPGVSSGGPDVASTAAQAHAKAGEMTPGFVTGLCSGACYHSATVCSMQLHHINIVSSGCSVWNGIICVATAAYNIIMLYDCLTHHTTDMDQREGDMGGSNDCI